MRPIKASFIDIETTGLKTTIGEESILGVYLDDEGYDWSDAEQKNMLSSAVNERLANGATFIAHNAEFDIGSLRKFGVHIPKGRYICTKVLSHCINPQRISHSLASYGDELDHQKLEQPPSFLKEWDTALATYCHNDVKLLRAVWYHLLPHLQRDKRLRRSFFNIHMPFVEVMMSLHKGMCIDSEAVVDVMQKMVVGLEVSLTEFNEKYPFVGKLKHNKEEGYSFTGKMVTPNLDSPNDVVSLLIQHKWKPSELTKTGRYQTSQAILKRDFAQAPEGPLKELLGRLIDLRSCLGISKQLQTLFTNTVHKQGRIYCNWHQTGTVTHRLSSSSPNLQNISTRHPVWGPMVRACFDAPPGYVMLVGDLSQIELAILAYYLELYAGDSSMAEAARAELDFHSVNTENWYHVKQGEDTFKNRRTQAKNGIFATNYGASARRLSLTLNIPLSEAREILDTVSSNIPIDLLKSVFWNSLKQKRDIEGVFNGFRKYTTGFFYDAMHTRHFYPQINSSDVKTQKSAERQSFNCLMQGGCFSIFAYLCIKLFPTIEKYQGQFAALVHDEAIIYVPVEHGDVVLEKANRVFSSLRLPTKQGGVPVRAEFHKVKNWSEK